MVKCVKLNVLKVNFRGSSELLNKAKINELADPTRNHIFFEILDCN